MAATTKDPDEVDVSTIQYTNADGTTSTGTGSGSSGSGTGWLGSVVGAIGPIISALFPNGIGGNSSANYPVVTTTPNGNTNVNLAGSSNILVYVLLAMVAFLLFTGRSPIQPEKKK